MSHNNKRRRQRERWKRKELSDELSICPFHFDSMPEKDHERLDLLMKIHDDRDIVCYRREPRPFNHRRAQIMRLALALRAWAQRN